MLVNLEKAPYNPFQQASNGAIHTARHGDNTASRPARHAADAAGRTRRQDAMPSRSSLYDARATRKRHALDPSVPDASRQTRASR
jgi:hypothetical protein